MIVIEKSILYKGRIELDGNNPITVIIIATFLSVPNLPLVFSTFIWNEVFT